MMRYAAIRLEDEANRTQEIAAVDILEETPIDAHGAPRTEVPSIWPLAVDPFPAETTFKIAKPPRRGLRGVVVGAMALSLAILIAALSHAPGGDGPPATAAAPAAPMTTVGTTATETTVAPEAPRTATAEATATVSSSGTLTSPGPSWPMFVDGKRITATSAIVSCGVHTVRVGNTRARKIDVPCGGTIVMDPPGRPYGHSGTP
jgi:hypothetical protein